MLLRTTAALLLAASMALASTSAAAADKGVPTGGKCGGLPGLKCAAAGEFCMKKTGQCSVADAAGVCTAKPQVCNKIYKPVCGCDDKTYGNECEAKSAGVSLKATGACKPKG